MCYENDTRDNRILTLTINANQYINQNTRRYFINISKPSALLIFFSLVCNNRNTVKSVIKLSLHFYFYDNDMSYKNGHVIIRILKINTDIHNKR